MSTRQFFHEIFSRATALRPGGARVETFAEISSSNYCYPLIKISISDPHQNQELPTIAIFAGLHGNEPAGVRAALDFAARRAWPLLARYRFEIFPCLNPWGYEHNTHHNPQHTDINQNFFSSTFCAEAKALQRHLNHRSEPYALAFDLHEDNVEALDLARVPASLPGTYCVLECLASGHLRQQFTQPFVGYHMLEAVQALGFPSCQHEAAYGYQTTRGLILKEPRELQRDRALANSLCALLSQNHCQHALSCATPAHVALEQRVTAHVHALYAAIQRLDQGSVEPLKQAA